MIKGDFMVLLSYKLKCTKIREKSWYILRF